MKVAERELALSEGLLTLLLIAGLGLLALVFYAGARVGAGLASAPVAPTVAALPTRHLAAPTLATPTPRLHALPPGFIGPPRQPVPSK